jgi:hypothetical protein
VFAPDRGSSRHADVSIVTCSRFGAQGQTPNGVRPF